MIEDYTKNACPVIEEEDLDRAILFLPDLDRVTSETKSETHIVLLDGDEDKNVIFDWDDEAEGWRLRNKVIYYPNNGRVIYDCTTCGEMEHIVNKTVTKKKCIKCNVISDL